MHLADGDGARRLGGRGAGGERGDQQREYQLGPHARRHRPPAFHKGGRPPIAPLTAARRPAAGRGSDDARRAAGEGRAVGPGPRPDRGGGTLGGPAARGARRARATPRRGSSASSRSTPATSPRRRAACAPSSTTTRRSARCSSTCRSRRAAPTRMVSTARQPLPSADELEAAVEVLREDPELGPALREGRLVPYRSMPPLAGDELPDGRVERMLTVGLRPAEGSEDHEIVGVRLGRREVVRFEGKAPSTAMAGARRCGIPDANQPTTMGRAGAARITVTRDGETLWRLIAVRPAASSGENGLRRRAARRLLPRQARAAARARADPQRPLRRQRLRAVPRLAERGEPLQGPGRRGGARLPALPAAGQDGARLRRRPGQLRRRGGLRGRRGGRAGQRARGRLVPLRQPLAAARRRHDPRALRLRRGRQLVRLPDPPPPRVLAAGLRHRGRGRGRRARAQRPAAPRPRLELAHAPPRGPAASATRAASGAGGCARRAATRAT